MPLTSAPPDDPRASLRRAVYLLLALVSIGQMLGRILAVNAVDMIRLEDSLKKQGRADWPKQRPFLSANDRSRWCTVRSLVEHGTYAIDEIVSQPNWDTIDMVKHDGEGRPAPEAERGHLYSSKPPLLATLMAGQYWLIHHLSGLILEQPATLGSHPYEIGRAMIITWNLLPLCGYFWVLACLIERLGSTDWGRLFAMACATFGTFLTTFAVTINNHLPAAVATAFTLYAALKIVVDGDYRRRWFVLAGGAGAFAAATELPALALLASLGALLVWRNAGRALTLALPAALVVCAAAWGTNYLAHGTLTPAYKHRVEGDNWYDFRYMRDGKERLSYWAIDSREQRGAIDRGEPSRATYALHVLVGHHGIFSLTPIWLLAGFGLFELVRRPGAYRWLGVWIAGVSLVCLAFYLGRGLEDRNYGGMTSGFRWVFWFAPLWLAALVAAADRFSCCAWGRLTAGTLLVVSVLSASYPTWNPWTHPWILNFLLHGGWATLGV